MSLAASEYHNVSFEQTILSTFETVPPRLLLAAFNLSLVGIFRNDRTEPLHKESVHLKLGDRKFRIHWSVSPSNPPLFPLYDVGIVRAVDTRSNSLLVISQRPLPNDCDIILLKSSFPLPQLLTYAPGQLCYPYQSSEVEGEGSRMMKARTNVKRKWQGTG